MAISREIDYGHRKPPTVVDLLGRVVGQVLHRGETSKPLPSLSFESEGARVRREAYEREGSTYVGNVYLGSDGSGPGQQAWRFRETNPKTGVDGDRALHNGDYLTIYAPPDPEKLDPKKPKAIKRVVWEGKVSLRDKMIRNPQGEVWNFPYPEGGVEGDWVDWFGKHYEAELRTPVGSDTLAAAGETAEFPDAFGTLKDFQPQDRDTPITI